MDIYHLDYYKLNLSHYAARQNEIAVLIYLHKKEPGVFVTLDNFGHNSLHYGLMYNKIHAFVYLYFRANVRLNLSSP